MSDTSDDFQHASSFEQGELSGNLHLGKFEAQYEELFAEVIEDGVITAEERARLDRAADALGLDRERLRRLEQALQIAYEARHRIKIRDLSRPVHTPVIPIPQGPLLGDEEPAPSLRLPPILTADPNVLALQQRIAFLEGRVAELERELQEARSQIAVEVDLSDVRSAAEPFEDDPNDLMRRVRRDPRDHDALHALYRLWARREDLDRRFCAAQALVFRGVASEEERTFFQQHRPEGLIRPSTSVSPDAWRRLLFHPEEEILTGEIFSIIASAVLLGRVSALRRDKALPVLDPATRQDPQKSTLQAVRCFTWAASILGMTAPALYAAPQQYGGLVEMVPGLPPVSRLGKQALSGRNAPELAFLAGRHLSWYREEHFVRLLVPSIPDLEDLFLAALLVGNPAIPLSADRKVRITPLAKAIEPILEPILIDRLRGYFLRFVEEGGRTNLQRWANAANLTGTRAGFLLCGDFEAARAVLTLEDPSTVEQHLDDLVVFVTSDRYTNLRRQIGIALR
ncbi:MAG: hypothetical protein RMJ98_02500 [Myxococcales bacterium]|nr:hypothetical protein [Polyangiaceae bacterium]MDW8248159.1 hypothetical protein [Myxococcales bacterium]